MLLLGVLQPQYQWGDRDVLSMQVTMGDAMVQGNYVIYVKGPDLISAKITTTEPFGCKSDEICEDQLSFGKRFVFDNEAPKIDFESTAVPATPLELGHTGGVWLGAKIANQIAQKLNIPIATIAASAIL